MWQVKLAQSESELGSLWAAGQPCWSELKQELQHLPQGSTKF